MNDRPRPYLIKPESRRWTPWLWAVAMMVLMASWYVANREAWIGPLSLLFGLAIAAQGVDALRTGKMVGRFPNKWPVDADRVAEPISFWLLTVAYLAIGFMFTSAGVAMIAGWVGSV